jgi:hypothetical protein
MIENSTEASPLAATRRIATRSTGPPGTEATRPIPTAIISMVSPTVTVAPCAHGRFLPVIGASPAKISTVTQPPKAMARSSRTFHRFSRPAGSSGTRKTATIAASRPTPSSTVTTGSGSTGVG